MKRYETPVCLRMGIGAEDVIRTSGLVEADHSDDVVRDIWGIPTV